MRLADAPELVAFLDATVEATLAMQIDESGTIHIATMHYVHQNDPLSFYFLTQRKTEKCRLLERRDVVNAACTVGTVVGVPFAVQMRGVASLLAVSENPELAERYYQKRQSKNQNVEGVDTVLVQFTPDWARFTDYSKGWETTLLELS